MNFRESIEVKVLAIAKELEAPRFPSVSVFTGKAGEVLFFMNLYRYTGKEEYYEKAFTLLDEAMDLAFSQAGSFTYCSGLAGFGWFLSHLQEYGYAEIDGQEELLSQLDAYLYKFLQDDLNRRNLDLLHGATGTAVYYLKRGNEKALDTYVNALAEQAIREEDGSIKWPFHIHELEPEHFNFGLAHGIPAQVSTLAQILLLKGEDPLVEELLRGSVNYLMKNRRDVKPFESIFPISIKPEGRNRAVSSRMAWCYGDLGISCSLWTAAEALKDDELKKYVTFVMEHNVSRKEPKDTLLSNGGLCHGTAGIALMFRRFFDLTGSQVLKNASDYWTGATMNMAVHGDKGIAGFLSHQGAYGWKKEYGVLSGAAGIGLWLLSYLDNSLTDWDQMLRLPEYPVKVSKPEPVLA